MNVFLRSFFIHVDFRNRKHLYQISWLILTRKWMSRTCATPLPHLHTHTHTYTHYRPSNTRFFLLLFFSFPFIPPDVCEYNTPFHFCSSAFSCSTRLLLLITYMIYNLWFTFRLSVAYFGNFSNQIDRWNEAKAMRRGW